VHFTIFRGLGHLILYIFKNIGGFITLVIMFIKNRHIDAIKSAIGFRMAVTQCSFFQLQNTLNKAKSFFSQLSKVSPQTYAMVRIHEKEIYEIAFQRRTGKMIILD